MIFNNSSSSIKLSVLDQSVATSDHSHDTTLQNTLELAGFCEELGYNRFWVSEHHNHPTILGTAPEILMGAIAARTRKIRIGSAGIMLPHYASLKVAEQFRVLDALAPGRIDLGVGRAPGSDRLTARLLNPNLYASDEFPQKIMELKAWVDGEELPSNHPGHRVHAYPATETHPTLWVLGSSDYGAQLAAHLGLNYAFAHFITDGAGTKEALDLYRNNFKPNGENQKPCSIVCVWALAAETEEEAWIQFESRMRWRMDRNMGVLGPLLPPQNASRTMRPDEELYMDEFKKNALVGSVQSVKKKLLELANHLEIDELVIITWTHDHAVQRRSYELLAEAFNLQNQSIAA